MRLLIDESGGDVSMVDSINIVTNARGQTSIEYLLILVVAFATTYLVVTGPLSVPTRYVFATIRSGLQNAVRNGEWGKGAVTATNAAGHPSDPRRFEALHL